MSPGFWIHWKSALKMTAGQFEMVGLTINILYLSFRAVKNCWNVSEKIKSMFIIKTKVLSFVTCWFLVSFFLYRFLVVLWCFIAAACLASGNFILCFPEESRSYLPKLMPMFYENLQDNIPSVRSGAAQALSCVAKTYGNTLDSMCRWHVCMCLW